jgi:hypothetical protein
MRRLGKQFGRLVCSNTSEHNAKYDQAQLPLTLLQVHPKRCSPLVLSIGDSFLNLYPYRYQVAISHILAGVKDQQLGKGKGNT